MAAIIQSSSHINNNNGYSFYPVHEDADEDDLSFCGDAESLSGLSMAAGVEPSPTLSPPNSPHLDGIRAISYEDLRAKKQQQTQKPVAEVTESMHLDDVFPLQPVLFPTNVVSMNAPCHGVNMIPQQQKQTLIPSQFHASAPCLMESSPSFGLLSGGSSHGPPASVLSSTFMQYNNNTTAALITPSHSCQQLDPMTVSSLASAQPLPLDSTGAVPPPMPLQRKTSSNMMDTSTHSNSSSVTTAYRPYQDEQWMAHYQRLVQFRQEKGHCMVPHLYPHDLPLSRWVKRQRTAFKELQNGSKTNALSADRVRLLEDIGFVWDSHGSHWDEQFQALRHFADVHGHTNVPSRYAPNRPLASWVRCQRRQYRNYCAGTSTTLTADRLKALEGLGFQFVIRPKALEKALQGGSSKMSSKSMHVMGTSTVHTTRRRGSMNSSSDGDDTTWSL